MTREDLKSLIRECLIEIITEGAVSPPRDMQSMQTRSRIKESAAVRAAIQDAPRRKTLGGLSLDRPAIPQQTPPRVRESAVANVTSRITSDPVLTSIFADTAATTLQEQTAAERMRPGTAADPISLAAANHDPQALFGEAANNWAALAFGDGPPGR